MKKITVLQICVLGFAAALNVVGGNLALVLRLPVYLDALGTMVGAALYGPVWGMVPGILSGIFTGAVSDVYSFYYIPVQMVTGLMAGLVFHRFRVKGPQVLGLAAIVSLPGTVVSSVITAALFGGITSSGSSMLVQLLHGMGMNLTLSVCVVQAVTDYADRVLVLAAAAALLALLPASMRQAMQKGRVSRGTV